VNPPYVIEKSTVDDKNVNPPMFDVPLVVLLLLGFLVLIHVLRALAGESWQVYTIFAFAFSPERFLTEAALAQLPGSKWWSFLTSGFIHADWLHLGFNSLWLVIFGTPVARVLGNWRFLLLATVSTIAGSAAILATHWGERLFLLGASGAVSGLTAAAIPIMYGLGSARSRDVTNSLALNSYMNSQRALTFTAVWFALQIIPQWASGTSSLVTGTAFLDERPIAWEAHLGGFIAGLILFFILRRQMLPAQFKS
jgi:membrane associated rhomboid family serine protease